MKIKSIKVIDGKNKWSESKDKLIHMVLDLGEFEEKPSNKIEGFYERIKEYLPSLKSHRCSEGKPGGFFKRVKEGTWMGHIIEHVALELQTLAGMDTGWGRTRGVKGQKGVYNVVFNYEDKDKGKLAAREAFNVVTDIINDRDPQIDNVVKKLKPKNLQENIRRILREEGFIPLPIKRRVSPEDIEEAFDYALERMGGSMNNPDSILYKEKGTTLKIFAKFVIDEMVTYIEQDYFNDNNRIYFSDNDEDYEIYHEKIRKPLLRHYDKRIKEKYDEVMSSNNGEMIQESIRRVLKEETSIKKKLLNSIEKFGLLNTIRIVGGFDKLTRIIGRDSITKEQKVDLIIRIVKEYGEDGYYIDVRYYDIFIDIDINFTDSYDYLTEVMAIFDNGRIDINQYPYDDEMEEHDLDNPTRKGIHLSHLSESDIDGIIVKLFKNLKQL